MTVSLKLDRLDSIAYNVYGESYYYLSNEQQNIIRNFIDDEKSL